MTSTARRPTHGAPTAVRERVSATEWATRVNLAACYRLMALYGMTDLLYNHITARAPGPAFNRGEKDRLVANLGSNNAMVLRNHGLLACGFSIAQAFNMIYWPETTCRIQVDMLACGRPLHLPDQAVVTRTAAALSGAEITLPNEADTNPALKAGAQSNRSGYGLLEWPARLRKLDRIDRSFRD